jgi:RNA polymerase sigma-70 factor, ECF subfamily
LMFGLFPLIAMAVRSDDDSDLVRRLKERDQDAMAKLYDRHARVAYGLILRIVRNGAVAEDLLQETFLRVWNRVHAFDPQRGLFGPWILAIARNRAIDYLRSVDGRAMQSPFELEKMEEPALFADFERDILNMDRAALLRDALGKLTQNQRIVIELAYYEGLSQTEMAERMKQPLGTVKTWVRSALKTLREHLAQAATA